MYKIKDFLDNAEKKQRIQQLILISKPNKMMSNSEFEVFHLIYQNQSNVIKVGVGGGGSNYKPHV
jgi:hypothetical protein